MAAATVAALSCAIFMAQLLGQLLAHHFYIKRRTAQRWLNQLVLDGRISAVGDATLA